MVDRTGALRKTQSEGAEAGLSLQPALLRRKIAARPLPLPEDPPHRGSPADRGWRLALARAARDLLKLPVELRQLSISRRSMAELLDLPEALSLFALLEGPGEGLGLMVLSPSTLSAVIEAQTAGRVPATPPPPRKPTLTDAAMVAPLIDAALARFERALEDSEDMIWAGGYRYGSFLDGPGPLPLLLDEAEYHVLSAELALGDAGRRGQLLLALPAGEAAAAPMAALSPTPASGRDEAVQDAGLRGADFSAALGARLAGAHCVLDAILGRLSLPLSRVAALGEGDLLELPGTALDQVVLTSLGIPHLAQGKLGQSRGMRALRLATASLPELAEMPVTGGVAPGEVPML